MWKDLQRFFGELRRRNVLRVGAAFLITGWVALQIIDILGPALGMPEWTIVAVAVVVVTGLPVALAVAWFFELTPGGMVPTDEVPLEESITGTTARRIDRVIIALLAAAVLFFIGEFLYRYSQPAGSAVPPPLTLAVFPPAVGMDSGHSFGLATQIAAEVSRALMTISSLPVTPIEVVEHLAVKTPPAAAAAELGVRYLLLFEPNTESDVLVMVQLYDVLFDEVVWSASFDAQRDDALVFQQRVSQQVALELGVLSATEANNLFALPTQNTEAYGLYLLGMQEYTNSPYEARKEASAAEQYFTQALDLDPRFALAHAALCRIDLSRFSYSEELAAFERAERHCHRALTLGRSSGEAHIALGALYNASGQYARAEESFLEALSINPSYIAALLGLALAYDLQGENTRAEEVYLKAVRAQPSYYLPYDKIADHYYALGNYARSRENLVFAQKLAPDDPLVLSDIGTTYLLTGDFKEAEAAFKQSLALNPEEAYALGNLATTYYFQGAYSDARKLYERAIERDPHSGTAWRNLGDVLLAVGDEQQARRTFEKAVELLEPVVAVNARDSMMLSNYLVAVASLGEIDRFRELVVIQEANEITYPGAGYDLAIGHCRLQLLAECAAYVREAKDGGFPLALLKADPDLAPVSDVLDE